MSDGTATVDTPESQLTAQPSRLRRWAAKAGAVGIAYFTIKGLFWVGVGLWAWHG